MFFRTINRSRRAGGGSKERYCVMGGGATEKRPTVKNKSLPCFLFLFIILGRYLLWSPVKVRTTLRGDFLCVVVLVDSVKGDEMDGRQGKRAKSCSLLLRWLCLSMMSNEIRADVRHEEVRSERVMFSPPSFVQNPAVSSSSIAGVARLSKPRMDTKKKNPCIPLRLHAPWLVLFSVFTRSSILDLVLRTRYVNRGTIVNRTKYCQ